MVTQSALVSIVLGLSALPLGCGSDPGPLSGAERAYSRLHGESDIFGKSFDEIIADYRAVAAAHSDVADIIEYGTSTEGRKLTAMKITTRAAQSSGPRPAVLISEGIHGNEYLNITDRLPRELLDGAASNSPFRQFLAKGGILYLVPILNPDGYTARQRENGRGRDLNRNFTIKAAGNNGFTEPETAGISSFIARELQTNGATLEASMEYHCCIGGLIHPWAYTARPMESETMSRHVEVGRKVQSLFSYPYGTVREIVGYDAVGGSDDYYLETYGRRSFSFEGAEGSEARNLAKHVEMWQNILALAAAPYPDIPGGSQQSTADLFVAIGGNSQSGTLTLLISIPDTLQSAELCVGNRAACPGGAGSRIPLQIATSRNGRHIFATTTPVAPNATGGTTFTVVAASGLATGASPYRVISLVPR